MKYRLVFTVDAREDVDKITAYYAGQFSTGAGDFLDAFVDTLDALVLNPQGYQVRFEDNQGFSRRGILVKAKKGSKNYAKRFPYLVLYHLDNDRNEIIITEVFSTSFPEEYMRGRLE